MSDRAASGDAGARSRRLDEAQRDLDALAHFLDETFAVPGVRWRIGLEALIGLVPVVGDVVSGGLGAFLIYRAVQFRLPRVVIARMAFNTLVDLTFGAIPLVGDLFDFAYRSNRRNIDLFRRYAGSTRSTRGEWLFFGGLALVAVGILALIVMALGWLVGEVVRAL